VRAGSSGIAEDCFTPANSFRGHGRAVGNRQAPSTCAPSAPPSCSNIGPAARALTSGNLSSNVCRSN
jgi:hypothetical protein